MVLLINIYLFLSSNEDGGALLQDPLRSSLHDHDVARVAGVLGLMDGHLVLICGIEGDLADLLVLLTDGQHVPEGQLHALQQGGFRGVSTDFLLEDGDSVLTSLELSAVAEGGDAGKSLESRAGAVWKQDKKLFGNLNYQFLKFFN